jgi:hypothetical protein
MRPVQPVRSFVSILFLDGFLQLLSDSADSGPKLHVTNESQWNPDKFKAPPALLTNIESFTWRNDFDLVILGDNDGVGLLKAQAIAPKTRPRTVVVWDDYKLGDEAPYVALGFKQFMSRRTLADHLLRFISAA